MTTKELIDEVMSLPVEQRMQIVDSILRSLNAPDAETDALWVQEATRRQEELLSGKIIPVASEDVFTRIQKQYGV